MYNENEVYSLIYEPRKLKATERIINAVYEMAKLGMRGESLAFAAGMQPIEYNSLREFCPEVSLAEQKGRADGEKQLSQTMFKAAMDGDAKVALDILKHRHDWVSKTQVDVNIDQRINITEVMQEAEKRVWTATGNVIEGEFTTEKEAI